LSATPSDRALERAQTCAHGLLFHRLHDAGSRPDGQGSLTGHDLRRVLDAVGVEHILSPKEWTRRVREGSLRAEDRCLTFDDGLASQHRVALPVLDAVGLKAFWFVHSSVFEGRPDRNEIAQVLAARHLCSFAEFIEEFLRRCPPPVRAALDDPAFPTFAAALQATAGFYSERDLAYRYLRNCVLDAAGFARIVEEMLLSRGLSAEGLAAGLWMDNRDLAALASDGHWIGLHSYDHPFELARLAPAEQRSQYERNAAHITRVTGCRPRSMSHPLNSYDESTLRILADLGVECGFRDDMLAPRGGALNRGPLELARLDAAHLVRTLASGAPA
jgi:peptidoglycan/xylan/chitin deacetylase (PgdA/CDA1 family)